MVCGFPANAFFLKVNMTTKCHNHRLLIDPLHFKEGTKNTDSRNINSSKATSLFLTKMISELEENKKTKVQHKLTQQMGATSTKVSNIHTAFQKFLDILS